MNLILQRSLVLPSLSDIRKFRKCGVTFMWGSMSREIFVKLHSAHFNRGDGTNS